MTKKRKSGGRKKGQSGNKNRIQCSRCGRLVPRDKIKKITKRIPLVDRDTAYNIRKQGGFVMSRVVTKHYCTSCAIHSRQVHIRSKKDRDKERPKAEQKITTQVKQKTIKDAEYKKEQRKLISKKRKEQEKHGKKVKRNES